MIYTVVGTRADARGTVEATRRFIRWNGVSTTLVIVEFGGPRDGRNPLHVDCAEEGVFFVYVPEEIAAPYCRDGMWGEYAAKNLGIRVAGLLSGENNNLVICTNADCCFSRELSAALLVLSPDPTAFYRAPRWDYVSEDEEPGGMIKAKYVVGPSFGMAAGDFTGMLVEAWRNLGYYPESVNHRVHLDSAFTDRAISRGYHGVELPNIWHCDHPESMCNVPYHPSWGCMNGADAVWIAPAEVGLSRFALDQRNEFLFMVYNPG